MVKKHNASRKKHGRPGLSDTDFTVEKPSNNNTNQYSPKKDKGEDEARKKLQAYLERKKQKDAEKSANDAADKARSQQNKARQQSGDAEKLSDKVRSKLGKQQKNVNYDRKKSGGTDPHQKSLGHMPGNEAKYYALILLILGVHLYDIFATGFTIGPGITSIRLFAYFVVSFIAYLVLDDGILVALKEYTAVSLLSVFLGPLLVYVLSLITVPTYYAEWIKTGVMLFPWWVIYLTLSRGMVVPRRVDPNKNVVVQTVLSYAGNPTQYPKVIYTVLVFLFAVQVVLSPQVAQAANQATAGIQTPRLDPMIAVERLSTFVMNSGYNTVAAVTGFAQGQGERLEEYTNQTLGYEYKSEVEQNLADVEVSIDPLPVQREVLEGETFTMRSTITYRSQNELEEQMRVQCVLKGPRGDELRRSEVKERCVGGSCTQQYTETCTFEDMPRGGHTVEMIATFPFKSQAYTEYYFAPQNLTRDPTYQTKVSALNADTTQGKTTAGPARINTQSDQTTPQMPIIVNPERPKSFLYGFSIAPRLGRITNITNVEMHLPSYFELQQSACTVTGTDSEYEVLPSYTAYNLDTQFRETRRGNAELTCNVQYDGQNDYLELFEIQDRLIDDRIRRVVFTVIADYEYTLDESVYVLVRQNPALTNQDTRTGTNTNTNTSETTSNETETNRTGTNAETTA